MPLQPGVWVEDRYRVCELVASGGTATIYRVEQRWGGVWALKVLHRVDQELIQRLRQEGRVLARLQHPNVIAVKDTVSVEGQPGLIMEFVPGGRSLAHLIRRHGGLLDLDSVKHLGAQVIDGLTAVHSLGIVHRDIKPQNVLVVGEGKRARAMVCDFGLAKYATDPLVATRAGTAMGTPPYMSPEQISGMSQVDARADVFSLGALLYELVTGRRAFTGRDQDEVLAAVRSGTRHRVRDLRPSTPSHMVRAIDAALIPDRSRRTEDLQAIRRMWLGLDRPQRQRPASIASRVVGNAVRPLVALQGRDSLARKLTRLIEQGTRLITLHGPGGVGKSLLANHAASSLMSHFPGGVWRLDCSGMSTMADVQRGLQRLGVRRSLQSSLRTLLLLDDFEQLAADVGTKRLSDTLARRPSLQLLITSRARLNQSGERVVRVPPLDTESALGLLRSHAQSEGVDLEHGSDTTLRAIVTRLECLPLAIELAAPWLRLHDPQTLLSSLDERGILHALGHESSPHATLESVFDSSWRLLAPPTRLALCQLSAFRGDFVVEDALAVLDLSALDELDVEAHFHNLVDQCLLNRIASGSRPRFSLSNTTRHYAARRLADPTAILTSEGAAVTGPEAVEATHARYVQRVTRLAESVGPGHVRGPASWGPTSAPGLADLLGAIHDATDRGDAEHLSDACVAAWQLVSRRGGFASLLGALLAATDGMTPAIGPWVRLQRTIAAAALPLGRLDIARSATLRLLGLAREKGDPITNCLALIDIAAVRAAAGADRRALDACRQAIAIAPQEDTRTWALLRLAEIHTVLRRPDGGALETATASFRRSGDSSGIALCELLAARRALDAEDHHAAVPLARQALEHFREDADPRRAGEAEVILAMGLHAQSDDRAMATAQHGLRQIADTGDLCLAAWAVARVADLRGRIGSRSQGLAEVTRLIRQSSLPEPVEADLYTTAAELALADDCLTSASDYLSQARRHLPRDCHRPLASRIERVDSHIRVSLST